MRLSAFAAVTAALLLSACQDPAGVGLGLIDEDQADPSVRVVPLDDLDTLAVSVPAIGIADPGNNALSQGRVLVGSVLDAQFGDAQATAYVDLLQPSAAQDLEAADVRAAWIELPRTYAYGDTTTALPVELRPIEGSWDASVSYPADTVFAVGPALASGTLTSALADTLARFDLPESWVRANAATFVGDAFGDAFEGFAVQTAAGFAPSPGVVYGLGTFARDGAGLRLATAEDTLLFPLSEVFSSVRSQAPTAPPASILPVRRGSGAEVQFRADLGAVGAVPLARGILRLPLDKSFIQQGAFVRPLPPLAVLFGVREVEGGAPQRTFLGALSESASGDFAIEDTRPLTTALQRLLADPTDRGFDRYEIRPALSPTQYPASLDVLPLVRRTPDMDRPPRFTLTLVGASV